MTLFSFGSENPLVRRVRRHRSVSTLFRRAAQSPVPASVLPGPSDLTDTEPETPAEVVQAEMVSVRRASMPETTAPTAAEPVLPEAAPPSPARTTRRESGQSQSFTRPSEAASQAPGSTTQQSSTPDRPPVEESAIPEALEPVDSAPEIEVNEEDSSLTDTVWQRLKTIFQRHQEPQGEPSPTTSESEREMGRVDLESAQAEMGQKTRSEVQSLEETRESAINPPPPRQPVTIQRQKIEEEGNEIQSETVTEPPAVTQPETAFREEQPEAIDTQRRTAPDTAQEGPPPEATAGSRT